MARLSSRAILSLRFTAAGTAVGRSVGRFLRYVQYRDHGEEQERPGGVDGFLRYAAYRDRTSPHGRLFDADRDVGEQERRRLARFITCSVQGLPAQRSGRPQRAFYRLVISPEDARELDLRRITREVMGHLEQEAGSGGLGPWIAAEHRNTPHPHVHVVLAARREVAPGRYRTLVITKERLQRMKDAMNRELTRQRGHDREQPLLRLLLEHGPPRRSGQGLSWRLQQVAGRLAAQYRLEAERIALRQREENEWDR